MMEVIEVKCTSPFSYQPSDKRNSNASSGMMKVINRPPPVGIGSWHVAQLQLEIFCAGSKVTYHYHYL
jgi:hypothetical protein